MCINMHLIIVWCILQYIALLPEENNLCVGRKQLGSNCIIIIQAVLPGRVSVVCI